MTWCTERLMLMKTLVPQYNRTVIFALLLIFRHIGCQWSYLFQKGVGIINGYWLVALLIARLVSWLVRWFVGLFVWLFVGWLYGCLAGWMVVSFVGWLADWLVGSFIGWLVDWGLLPSLVARKLDVLFKI